MFRRGMHGASAAKRYVASMRVVKTVPSSTFLCPAKYLILRGYPTDFFVISQIALSALFPMNLRGFTYGVP